MFILASIGAQLTLTLSDKFPKKYFTSGTIQNIIYRNLASFLLLYKLIHFGGRFLSMQNLRITS